MNPEYVPLLAAFIGAIVGAITSIASIWMQSYINAKRERIKQSVSLALESYKCEISVAQNSRSGGYIHPIAAYLHYHMGLMKLVNDDKVTADNLKKLRDKNQELLLALKSEKERTRDKV
ncbi:hypothetical protein [Desulfomicrobium baculatum]|uniref:hypothetical protein n=1 Tax=Desulfomicrobium baculatum TaxID=899 RepID=UPI00019E21F9|nr:hypothetical protein [Desulfomicrobium baculatum]